LVNEFTKRESESFPFPKERMASIIGVHMKDLNKSLKILIENELVSTISYNGKIIYEVTR
jgi:hypothetical protein